MNAKQFIELVRKMRERQNAYYRQGRKQSDLIASKELEKEVDRALLDGISFLEDGDISLTPSPSPAGRGEDAVQNSLFE